MKFWLSLLFLALAATVQAQTFESFWDQPDKTIRDASGKVTYAEKRDRANSIMKVFTNGGWITEHYIPHTSELSLIEAPDTQEEWLYHGAGHYFGTGNNASIGLRVRIDGLQLLLYSEADVRLSADGFPTVTIDLDAGGRAATVHNDRRSELAHFRFDNNGYLRAAVAGIQKLELSVPTAEGKVTETLAIVGGRELFRAVVASSAFNPHAEPFCLDIVKTQLGLGDDWEKQVTFRYSTTGTVVTTRNSEGKVILYIVRHGKNRFGFDASGRPLFIDLGAPLVASLEDGTDTTPAISRQSGIAPTHIVLTVDGRVGGCVEGAGAGAVACFWGERGANGMIDTRYRTIGGVAKAPPK